MLPRCFGLWKAWVDATIVLVVGAFEWLWRRAALADCVQIFSTFKSAAWACGYACSKVSGVKRVSLRL